MKIWQALKKIATRLFKISVSSAIRKRAASRGARLTVERLDERVCPSLYYWLPEMVDGARSVSMARGSNWVDGPGENANRYNLNDPPDADSELYFTGLGNSTCVFDWTNRFASINVAESYNTGVIKIRSNWVWFDGSDEEGGGIERGKGVRTLF